MPPEDPEDPEYPEDDDDDSSEEEEDAEESDEEEEPEEEEAEESEEEEEAVEEDEPEEEEEQEEEEEEEEDSEEEPEESESESESSWLDDVALPELDEDVFASADDFESATEEDFEDDAGDWSVTDYLETAGSLFGALDFFGDSAEKRYLDEGYSPLGEAARGILQAVEEHLGTAPPTVQFFEREGRIVPRGFLTTIALEALETAFPDLDLSKLHVTVPRRPPPAPLPEGSVRPARELPAAIRDGATADSVDLRKFATPVGDQGPTSRCAAFAWTHALEMLARIQNREIPRLACSFTMYRFQQRQGDARDFKWAWKGGDGTSGTWEPGDHLFTVGTCRHDHWPDDEKHPRVSLEEMEADAGAHRFEADVYDVTVEDMKKLLSAGLPVQISMATGDAFSDIGRDGILKVAEGPKGEHGYHAMLCVGYVGNYFIVKNSWGEDWGHQGYCYIPKKVLAESEPEAVAIVPRRAGAPRGGPPPAPALPRVPDPGTMTGAAQAQTKPAPVTTCAKCTRVVPHGKFCNECGAPLPPPPRPAPLPHERRFCTNCGMARAGQARFCAACGTPHV